MKYITCAQPKKQKVRTELIRSPREEINDWTRKDESGYDRMCQIWELNGDIYITLAQFLM